MNPTATTTPDQGGTLAVSGIINTGHDSTLTFTSAFDIESNPPDNNSEARSAKWSSFQSFTPASGIQSLRLKVGWNVSGGVTAEVNVGGGCGANISFAIDYSLNGGANWINALSGSRSANQSGDGSDSDSINESGTVDILLSPSQNISLVQMRDLMSAGANASAPNVSGATASAEASITTSISGIHLLAAEIVAAISC